ncbi:hypothetical protein D2V93_05615 [Flagellimonas taeanensis]|uniref:DUF3997 domain-containing protein n=1 Tax=Flavobacteriaceae TaxID=49546 RepID=UPI000E69EC8D|nr:MULTISPECIES: DUF3997 domain-containing protein [Allomuricauda]MDC6386549.1 DUF3997 domain-containing protein [Muricauda sp. SK9]RIV52125.1 hypothetical protein D2V93_05615 [Allomuricauda taeanensis]
MKKRIENILTFLILVISLNSCCIGAKEDYLGNNIYLSEYDNVDRRILYQTESCTTSGIEIIPMTVLEIAHNNKWIIAKTGNGRKRTESKYFKYWVINNDYENLPDSETVKSNTTEFDNRQDFEKFQAINKIGLTLRKID